MKDLEHYLVSATDGDVGRVADFRFDESDWSVHELVMATGGLVSEAEVRIRPSAFGKVDPSAKRFHLKLSMADVAAIGVNLERPGAHSRSAQQIVGYSIDATNGRVGHLEDLVLDDETWRIEYMVIAPASLLPRKRVLISPESVMQMRSDDRTVEVGLTREAILARPEWDATYPIDADYALQLALRFGGIPGWRGRDRSLKMEPSPPVEHEGLSLTDARVAAHEEEQIRAADQAVIEDARAGRMP